MRKFLRQLKFFGCKCEGRMPKKRDGQEHYCELCQDTFQSYKSNTSKRLAFRSHQNTNKRHKRLLTERNLVENGDEMIEDGNEGDIIDFDNGSDEEFSEGDEDKNETGRNDLGKHDEEDQNQKADKLL